jgi:hypothetical protein
MRIRRPTGLGASPLPGMNENHTELMHVTIAQVNIGGDR